MLKFKVYIYILSELSEEKVRISKIGANVRSAEWAWLRQLSTNYQPYEQSNLCFP